MRARSLVVLALAAALLGAPPRAFAAGNELASPSVTPTAGTTATLFVFAVRYEGQFPAQGVSVQVAGLSVPMLLVDGSPSAGTWSATLALPAGTWPVSFVGVPERGNPAQVAGPTVTVAEAPSVPSHAAAPVTIPATPAIAPAAPQARRAPTGATPPAGPAPAVPAPAAPQPPAATEPPVAGPAASPAVAPTDSRAPAAGSQPPPSPDAGAAAPQPAPRTGTASSAAGPSRVPASGATTRAEATMPGAMGREPVDEALHDEVTDASATALGVAMAGLAAVAVLGTALILLGRRRRTQEQESTASAAAAGTSDVLQRRAIRRARVRLDEDPVISALGIGSDRHARTPRRRTTPVDPRRDPPGGRTD